MMLGKMVLSFLFGHLVESVILGMQDVQSFKSESLPKNLLLAPSLGFQSLTFHFFDGLG